MDLIPLKVSLSFGILALTSLVSAKSLFPHVFLSLANHFFLHNMFIQSLKRLILAYQLLVGKFETIIEAIHLFLFIKHIILSKSSQLQELVSVFSTSKRMLPQVKKF